MTFIDLLKKYGLLASVILANSGYAQEAPRGLIGGSANGTAYAATTIYNTIESQILSLPSGSILSVALNPLGEGVVGGTTSLSSSYAAKISSSSTTASEIFNLPSTGSVRSVAINNAGQALLGGVSTSGRYVASVDSSSNVAQLIFSLTGGSIESVAINSSGQGIAGGGDAANPYAALVSSSGATQILNLPGTGILNAVAINDSGVALIGGHSNNAAYVAAVSSNIASTNLTLNLGAGSTIESVAINNSDKGLIGGVGDAGGAYAAIVSPSSNITTTILDLTAGTIQSVALNDAGDGIIGGIGEAGGAYAAFLSASNNTPIPILNLSGGEITSVAINNFSQGLIGGAQSGAAYAAIISPNIATPIFISLPAISSINSVSIMEAFTHIPTAGIRGNSLAFADYINAYVPQNAFYFVPSLFDGTLADALESAAPTRNAISFNTVMQNAFYLTTTLSTHLRDQHFMRRKGMSQQPDKSTAMNGIVAQSNDELLAALSPQNCKTRLEETPDSCSIWVEAVGAFAKQDAQHQTPEFTPTTGGASVAFDGKVSRNTRVGCGAAYLYTHIDEKHNAGNSKINQESLFVYASWDNTKFYVDGAIWGGLFQTKQTRKIHMTGFDFKSISEPDGGHLTPHFEFGYNYSPTYSQNFEFGINPLIMLDWANAWQESYKEKGDGPFNAGQKGHHASLLRTELGFRLSEILYYRSWNVIFQEKMSYVNAHSFGAGRVNAFLVGSPNSFTVETLTTDQNLAVAQFLLTFAPRKAAAPITTIFYQGEFGGSYQSHQLNFELGWNF